jgi:hypothetical protein
MTALANGTGYENVYRRRDGVASSSGTSQRPTQLSTAANEGLQRPGKRHDRERPKAIYEFLSQRRNRRDKASLH